MEKSKKRKRVELDLKTKVELINQHETSGKSLRKLAESFTISKTQVSSIIAQKEAIMDQWESNGNSNRKRLCVRTPLDQLNTLMWDWFQKARSQSIPVSGPMLQEKALKYATDLDIKDFKASNGWLSRFRQRNNINFASVCGESGSVNPEVVREWTERLPDILRGYAPKDIFNMDETGLFYRALPDRSLNIRGEDCKGGKKSKERLTVSLCVNMEGDFEKALVIGKSAVPRCFRNMNARNLPVTWTHNKKAWMTSYLFTDWAKQFNRKMKNANRHVLLLLDNSPAHPGDLQLTNVKLVFLPANTTSKLQPLDQGIIQNMKQLYRKKLLTSVIARIDESECVSADSVSKSVTVLDAVKWVSGAIQEITADTVRKCFSKSGITESTGLTVTDDEDEDEDTPLADLISLVSLARRRMNIQDEMTAEDFVNVDNDVPACDNLTENWEEELLSSHAQESVFDDQTITENMSDGEMEEEPLCNIKTHKEALQYLEQLKLFCLNRDLSGVLSSLDRAQDDIERLSVVASCAAKQTSILQYVTRDSDTESG